MITLTIDNSYSRIQGLTTVEFRALRNILSYETDAQAAYFSGGHRHKKYLLDKQGFFPTGLLGKVLSIRGGNANIVDKRVQPKPFSNIFKPNPVFRPYKSQTEAVYNLETRSGIVMPTGSGKSMIIAMTILKRQVSTLVVVPTLEIKHQLKSTLTEFFGSLEHIRVENIGSTALKKLKGYPHLIIDECHHAASKTYQTLNKACWNEAYYRLFLSATFFRNQNNEQLLFEGICGPVTYELTYKEAVKAGSIVPVEAYYYEVPKQKVDEHTWAGVYSKLVVNNQTRNELIAVLLLRLLSADKSTLCLVKEIKHGRILSEMTGVPFINGEDAESRAYLSAFNSGAIKAIIATTGVVGEGIDTKPCEYVLIAGLGKAKSAFMQQVGRSVRTYPGKESAKVVLFLDKSHKWTKAHFAAQRTVLKDEYGVLLSKLEV